MESILKEIKDLGVSYGSIALFAVLFWQQMSLMEKFKATIDSNTKATDALTAKIEQSIKVDENVVQTINQCKKNEKA